ncbi:Nn.00g012050.m01.CDS01 [Neocucurbitaria sp. VM-36]
MSDFYTPSDHIPDLVEVNKRKQQPQQPRQLLSCTKCRERKVKCDRTKPCSACCARGAPKDCHFVAEGGDYAPIQQSYELRKLRAENVRLKERLRACKVSIDDEDSDHAASPESQLGERPTSSQKRRTARQRRFQGSEWQDSIYFGSPGLASVVTDFAAVNLNPASASLSHLMPRGPEMYAPKNPPPHPFATLFKATPEECIPELLSCLPTKEELLGYLTVFEKRVNVCSFPHVPIEITRSEVERFLSDARKNSQLYPDMLALLFAAIAIGAQHSVWDKSGEQWKAEVMDVEMRRGDVYIAAAMQALRLASFMHKPTLLGIQALIMIGPYLTNSGRFLDAWTLFGTTIRLAHSIGLHRHPKYLDPAPPTQRECSIRQTLWWWMLHMDEQYSMTLGRPLGISGIGDCPWPHGLTTDPAMLRFGDFVNHFSILARQILSSDRLTHQKIDEYTEALRGLLETMPETLQFDESWCHPESSIPDWPLSAMSAVYYCKTHTYLILLNRQRFDRHTLQTQWQSSEVRNPTSSFRPVNRTPSSYPSTPTSTKASLRGRPLVLSSSEDILGAFIFFYRRVPAALIDWTVGQQAFNSCMILLLDAIENKRITEGAAKVEKAFVVFKELEENQVHKLAGLAVDRISWGLQQLRRVAQPAPRESSARGPHENHARMQASGQSEATRGSEPVDTVMGNTGLLLLEDPGLQAFVHEDWAPIAWAIPGDPRNFTKEQQQHLRAAASQPKSETDTHRFRSADMMQGLQKSTTKRLAPTRYATLSEDDVKPQSYTAPASPATLAVPTTRRHDDAQFAATRSRQEQQPPQGYHRVYPPHSQHVRAHETASAVEATSSSGWEYKVDPSAPSTIQQHSNQALTTPDSSEIPFLELRHNSCPTLLHTATDPPLLRPTYSSPSNVESPTTTQSQGTPLGASMSTSMAEIGHATLHAYLQSIPPTNVGNPSVHPPFAARPAAPMSSLTESTMSFSPTSDRTPVPSRLSMDMMQQQQQVAYSMPTQYSHAAATTITPLAEHMNLDEWQRYMGSSGAE